VRIPDQHQLLATVLAIAFGIAPLAGSADDLPLYPGATKASHQMAQPVMDCGHEISAAVYDTKDAPEKVAAWYKSRIPGAMTIRRQSDPNEVSIEVADPDGARAASITRMRFTSAKLQASAASIGMDKTSLGLERFDPPLGHAYLELEKQGGSNSAAADAVRAKLSAKCPKE
jgi:hypothetical protein